jgi:predicted Zn-dependent protease
MIIWHENLEKEAIEISKTLNDVYGFKTQLINKNMDDLFTAIPEFDGFRPESTANLATALEKFNGKAILILTNRDLYCEKNSKDDDWIFGFCDTNLMAVSNARMKRYDNQPSQEMTVTLDLYLKRLKALSIHEIGHDIVKANHYKEAVWVNTRTNYRLNLGPHCTDNSCVMYEIVDINAPFKEEGYLQLGDEEKYDAGLDDVLERIYSQWFCKKCLDAIVIGEKYK